MKQTNLLAAAALIGLTELIGSVRALSVPYNSLLTRGQAYNTFLGKGAKHGAVQVGKNGKRVDTPQGPVDSKAMTFNFTPPTADMSGVDLETYFTPPDEDKIDKALANLHRGGRNKTIISRDLSSRRAPANCAGGIKAHSELQTSYEEYLQTLDISASATISGWGQSASTSGKYLDKAEFSTNSLIYLATLEIKKQQSPDDTFKFNKGIFNNATFNKDFGDRWIRGFETGGKMIARLVVTAKNTASSRDIEANVEASLKFWGVSTDINASMKKSMEALNKQAEVKVSLFYQGDLGKVQQDAGSPSEIPPTAAEDAFRQVKSWSDMFLKNACSHTYSYRALLDEYGTLGNFPASQSVIDYGVAEQVSFVVLKELAKLSELNHVLQRIKSLADDKKQAIHFAHLDMVEESQKWIKSIATNPANAKKEAKVLLAKFKTDFYDSYKQELLPIAKRGEDCGTQGKKMCATGLCCSGLGSCGNSPWHCGYYQRTYCQVGYGTCFPGGAKEGDKCGAQNGNRTCDFGLCCSAYGVCTTPKTGSWANPNAFGSCDGTYRHGGAY